MAKTAAWDGDAGRDVIGELALRTVLADGRRLLDVNHRLRDVLAARRAAQHWRPRRTAAAGRSLFTDRIYLGYALTQGLAFAGPFAYISGSSFVFRDVFGVSADTFSLILGLNALALVAVGQLNARLLDRFDARPLLVRTLGVSVLAAGTMVAGALLGSLPLVAVALFVFVGSLGMVMRTARRSPWTGTLPTPGRPPRCSAPSSRWSGRWPRRWSGSARR